MTVWDDLRGLVAENWNESEPLEEPSEMGHALYDGQIH